LLHFASTLFCSSIHSSFSVEQQAHTFLLGSLGYRPLISVSSCPQTLQYSFRNKRLTMCIIHCLDVRLVGILFFLLNNFIYQSFLFLNRYDTIPPYVINKWAFGSDFLPSDVHPFQSLSTYYVFAQIRPLIF